MTSIKEYVSSCDTEQLKVLIDVASKRLKEVTSKGKVPLFGVFGGAKGAKWFSEKEAAENYYIEAAKESLKGRFPEVSLEKRLVSIEDLNDYLDKFEVDKLLASKPETVK